MKLTTSLSTAALATFLILAMSACSDGGGDDDDSPNLADSAAASTFDSTVPVQWFELLYARVKATGTNPPAASRFFGYTGVALYESIIPGMADHQTLQGQLNGFPAATIPAPANLPYHWPTVANRALAVACESFIPASQTQFDALEAQILAGFTTVPADVTARSIAYGEAVANAVLAWAATDGIAGVAACGAAFVPPVLPGVGGWTAVPPATGNGLLPCWGNLRTFAVTDTLECAPIGAPPFSTATTSSFYAQALVVYSTTGDAGANLTADQFAIANYWGDGATVTGTPPGHWIAIAAQMSSDLPLTLDRSAECFARVGIAVADAFTTCWKEKFTSYLQRPVTYIQNNIDATWDPLLVPTPNFPTYISGHSTQSGAAAAVLTDMLGPVAFTDTTHTRLDPELSLVDRSFSSFSEAASEAAVSRMYGGIHFLFDNYDGIDSGNCVGSIINANVHFLR